MWAPFFLVPGRRSDASDPGGFRGLRCRELAFQGLSGPFSPFKGWDREGLVGV